MSVHKLSLLSFLIILAILVAVTLVAHLNIRKSFDDLELVIHHHVPALELIIQGNKHLHEVNGIYKEFVEYNPIPLSDIDTILNQLSSTFEALIQTTKSSPGVISQARSIIGQIREILNASPREAIMEKMDIDGATRTRIEHKENCHKLLEELRSLIRKSYAPVSNNLTLDERQQLLAASRLLTLLSNDIDNYYTQSIISLSPLLNNIQKSLDSINTFKSLIIASNPSTVSSDQDLVEKLVGSLLQYRSAVILYRDEKNLGVSGANLIEITHQVTGAQKDAINLFNTLYSTVLKRINNSQAAIIVSNSRLQQLFFFSSIAGFIWVTALLLFFNFFLSHRIKTLTKGADQFANGNFDYRFKTLEKGHEFGDLANTFNNMARTLQQRDEEKNMYVEQLIHAQKMETIGNLAGGIAHEFNNILTIIIGNNELIQNDFPVGSDARSSSDAIQKAGLRARDVVTQLLTFSRLEKAEKSVINTGSIVRESLELIRSTTSANIHIDQNIEENIFPILGNETQLSQLIINLCSNARDAIENTEGTIVVNLCNRVVDNESDHNHESLAPGKYVKLQVSDDGMGMEKQTLSNIYDPYFTTKEFGKGTGIGLSVVHGIIQGYGGLIFVDSKLNIGTTFTIYLPAHVKECKDSHGAITYTPIGDFTILVVDDEPEIIRVGKRYLESLGYIVVSTIDPIKALEIIRKNPNHFDLIISDLEMPKMTGKHLLGEVLKICPGIKTILCTGYSVNFTNNDALAMGVDAFLMKPFTKSELAQKVSEVIDTEKQ